ncbi:MAG: response regulator transcription factor [Deltaproteobacteria bacterium]|nr:response regulator transcription factor [Deltaproteobacteria bacterium]
MSKIRVLLAEDHNVVRQGLRKILESDPEIEISGEAGDGRSAVEAAKRLRPTVVVVDIGLPGLNGIEATNQIMKGTDGVSVLILSMHSDDIYVRQALKAGAKGYLLKDSDDLDLIKAVKSIARGGSYFSPSVSKVLLDGYLSDSDSAADDPLSRLTGREREVLQLISEGKTNKEIARILSLSINTVESHRKHVMEKLDLHNTAEIVRFAVRKGIVY